MNYGYSYFDTSSIINRRAFINYLNCQTMAYAMSVKNDVHHLIFAKSNTTKEGKPLRKCDKIRFLYRYLEKGPIHGNMGKRKRPFYYTRILSPETYRHIFLTPTDSKNYELLFKSEDSGESSSASTIEYEEQSSTPPKYDDVLHWTNFLTLSSSFGPNQSAQIKDLYMKYKKALLKKKCELPPSEYLLKNAFQKILQSLNIDVTEMIRQEYDNFFNLSSQIKYDDINFWLSYLPNITDSKVLFQQYKYGLITLNCIMPTSKYMLKCAFEKILVGRKFNISDLINCEYDCLFAGPPCTYYQLEELPTS